MSTVGEIRAQWVKLGKEEAFDRRLDRLLDLIMRQTDYDRDEALDNLERNGLSVERTLVAYGGETEESPDASPQRSLNQTMFGEFRSFLDSAAITHNRKKELNDAMGRRRELIEQSSKNGNMSGKKAGAQTPKA